MFAIGIYCYNDEKKNYVHSEMANIKKNDFSNDISFCSFDLSFCIHVSYIPILFSFPHITGHVCLNFIM